MDIIPAGNKQTLNKVIKVEILKNSYPKNYLNLRKRRLKTEFVAFLYFTSWMINPQSDQRKSCKKARILILSKFLKNTINHHNKHRGSYLVEICRMLAKSHSNWISTTIEFHVLVFLCAGEEVPHSGKEPQFGRSLQTYFF